jgi:2-dehydro-3-deoxygluconokinase
MTTLKINSAAKYDVVSLGEIMLRLDPGEGRIRRARTFTPWEGGGEYNVARCAERVFGLNGAVLTGLAKNDVGILVESLALSSGIDMSYTKWFDYDGIGKSVRNAINFTERGFGVRAALGVSDRANSAASKLKADDFDLDKLFVKDGVKWLHTGGIFASLSESTAECAKDVMRIAKENGVIISYDLNYRPSLWQSQGGLGKARTVNRELAKYVDVMIGNEEDFTASLGISVDNQDETLSRLSIDIYKQIIAKASAEFPNFEVIATTLRQVKTATVNDWGAIAWSKQEGFVQAVQRDGLEILDRVGGGDSFASGLIYGILTYQDIQKAVNYGAAHGALAMTTPGDTSMANLAEVEKLVKGGSARVVR